MGLTRTTTRASRRRDSAGEPRGDGAYKTHIVERGRALRRPNPARGDAGTGLMTPNGRIPQRSTRMHARPPRACAGRKRGFEDAPVSSTLLGVSEACGGVAKRVARLMPDGCVAQNGVYKKTPADRKGAHAHAHAAPRGLCVDMSPADEALDVIKYEVRRGDRHSFECAESARVKMISSTDDDL
jgi:hypothetical protein